MRPRPSYEPRPEREGIKTEPLVLICRGLDYEPRPEREGIKTIATAYRRLATDYEPRPEREGIKTPCHDFIKHVCPMNRDLKEKGLRQGSLATLPVG